MRKELFDYCLTCSSIHKNIYQKVDDYYIGYTNKGEEFYIDEEDFLLVSKYMWRTNKGRVVTTIQGNTKYKQTQLALHNLVLHNYNKLILCKLKKEDVWSLKDRGGLPPSGTY